MPMGIVVISCVRPSVQPSMGLGLCIAYKALGRNGLQFGMLMYPDGLHSAFNTLVDTGDICCHYWQHILVFIAYAFFWYAVFDISFQYKTLPTVPIPPNTPKLHLGNISMTSVSTAFEILHKTAIGHFLNIFNMHIRLNSLQSGDSYRCVSARKK